MISYDINNRTNKWTPQLIITSLYIYIYIKEFGTYAFT